MNTNPARVGMPAAEPALRTAEVAKALGVSARAVRTWADEGKIACHRTFGGHRLFAVSEIRRVLASWGQAPGTNEGGDPSIHLVLDAVDAMADGKSDEQDGVHG
jgi:excisionase family DNA binding protein